MISNNSSSVLDEEQPFIVESSLELSSIKSYDDLVEENDRLARENRRLVEENNYLKNLMEVKSEELKKSTNDNFNRTVQIQNLESKLLDAKKSSLRYKNIKHDEKMIKFYTGLEKPIFNWLIKYGPTITVVKKFQVADHLLLVLMKLRLGLTNRDISYRFQLSFSSVSKILNAWLPKFSSFVAQNLLYWPEKIALRQNMPNCFKKNYANCVCIIDCTEIFIERPFNLNARAKTWSNYKQHNTIKYFVGCAPTGAINFLSDGWGGRVSDKEITNKCGFLDLIETQDQILADRGFTVGEEVACKGGVLVIPSFTKGKNQLSAQEVDQSRQIANVRIHIERVIGRMRKWHLLNTTIPISQVKLLDHIMVSIAGLVNLSDKIV